MGSVTLGGRATVCSKRILSMRNFGPGNWREWRYGNVVVPLYPNDPKAKPVEGEKPLNEVAHMTMRGLNAKNSVAKLTDAIAEMNAEPHTPTGRIKESRFREVLKDVAQANLSPEEVEAIWPSPAVDDEDVKMSRRGSKQRRNSSKGLG